MLPAGHTCRQYVHIYSNSNISNLHPSTPVEQVALAAEVYCISKQAVGRLLGQRINIDIREAMLLGQPFGHLLSQSGISRAFRSMRLQEKHSEWNSTTSKQFPHVLVLTAVGPHLIEQHNHGIGCSPVNDCTTHLIELHNPVIGRDLPPDLGHLQFVSRTKHGRVLSLLMHNAHFRLRSGHAYLLVSRTAHPAHGHAQSAPHQSTHLASGSWSRDSSHSCAPMAALYAPPLVLPVVCVPILIPRTTPNTCPCTAPR